MANLIQELIQKAARNPKRVALPECEAEKTLLAARAVLDSGIGMPVLVNDPAVIRETAEKAGVSTEGRAAHHRAALFRAVRRQRDPGMGPSGPVEKPARAL